ncbi:hypothetical protein [Oceanobacillus kapialis]|uniref:Uncharacterized protein n=1 Tax=Oceanobacillus kapialis TaxID=481353 RepID=A0ABW5Q090_9BACI
MKVEKAKDLIEELNRYVSAYENYHPQNVKQEAIKLYAELENVGKVAKQLNKKGYTKDGKQVAGKVRQVKLDSNDVTQLLKQGPEDNDQLHIIVKKALSKNRQRIS